MKQLSHDDPILLLDDVLSELDSSRQNHLLSAIKHIQTMITCTGLDDFVNNRFQIDKVFKVIDGLSSTRINAVLERKDDYITWESNTEQIRFRFWKDLRRLGSGLACI